MIKRSTCHNYKRKAKSPKKVQMESQDVPPVTDRRPDPDLSSPGVEVPVSHLLPKKERSPKQIAAFERMRAKRQEYRIGSSYEHPEQDKEKQKSIADAAAMFMEMRRKEKEAKKELAWEKMLNETVTKRMDEFENRVIDLFNEPIDRYVEKRKRKTTIPEQPSLPHIKEPEPDIKEPVKEKPKEEEFIPKKIKAYHATKQQNPFNNAHRKPTWAAGRGN